MFSFFKCYIAPLQTIIRERDDRVCRATMGLNDAQGPNKLKIDNIHLLSRLNTTLFGYGVRQRELHYADHSYEAVISRVVMLFSQCVMCKSSSPVGRSVGVTHQHRTRVATRKCLNHGRFTETKRAIFTVRPLQYSDY